MSCKFCEGKYILPDGPVTKTNTVHQDLAYLYTSQDDAEPWNYIRLIRDEGKPFLVFQNSSGEYVELAVEIKYCPLCGKELAP